MEKITACSQYNILETTETARYMRETRLDQRERQRERENPKQIPKVCANVSQVVFPLPSSFTAPSYCKTEQNRTDVTNDDLLPCTNLSGCRPHKQQKQDPNPLDSIVKGKIVILIPQLYCKDQIRPLLSKWPIQSINFHFRIIHVLMLILYSMVT